MTTSPQPLEVFAANYIALRQLVLDAGEAQWQAGQTPQPREDTTERSKNMTSDPTPSITADGRRLALRVAVLEAEAVMVKAEKALSASRRHLQTAIAKWQG